MLIKVLRTWNKKEQDESNIGGTLESVSFRFKSQFHGANTYYQKGF